MSPSTPFYIAEMVATVDSDASLDDFLSLEQRDVVEVDNQDASAPTPHMYLRSQRSPSDTTAVPTLLSHQVL